MATSDSHPPITYVIFAVNKHGKEFIRTKPQRTDNLTITNAMQKLVRAEVWFVGDVIRIEEVKDG